MASAALQRGASVRGQIHSTTSIQRPPFHRGPGPMSSPRSPLCAPPLAAPSGDRAADIAVAAASSPPMQRNVSAHVAAVETAVRSRETMQPGSPSFSLATPLPDFLSGPIHVLVDPRLPPVPAPAHTPEQPQQHQQQRWAADPRRSWDEYVQLGSFTDDYEIGELLGKGTFGEVRAATEKVSGREVAVKVLPKRLGDKDMRMAILQEVSFCHALQSCPAAVRLFQVYEDDGTMYITQELCSGGDVASLLAASPGGRLEEREAAAVMLSVLGFLSHAHSSGVCYGDVKPSNFVLRRLYPSVMHLIDPAGPKGHLDVCAVDFGCCQRTSPDACLADVPVTGTPAYLSPEAFSDCFGMAADVWAAGVMLYHLLSGSFPFWAGSAGQLHGMTSSELRDGITRGSPMFMKDPWASYSPRVKDLVCKMLEKNPEERITTANAAAHLWFAEVLGSGA